VLDQLNGCLAHKWNFENISELQKADIDCLNVSIEILLEDTGVVPVGLDH
jgi:hypothetical protein